MTSEGFDTVPLSGRHTAQSREGCECCECASCSHL